MSERDSLRVLLSELDRPVVPRPAFADELRARLLTELAHSDGASGRRPSLRSRLRPPPRRRRAVLAGAAGLAVAVAVIAAVVSPRPSPASALDVIKQARRAFSTIPPFQATFRIALNPDGSNPDKLVSKGATETVLISYGGPRRYRAEIVAQQPAFATR